MQANTCFCSSSDWDGRSHNDGCAQAAVLARERERGRRNNEAAEDGAMEAQPSAIAPVPSQQGLPDIEDVEPGGPPPEYMLVDEHGQMMVDEHGRKQRWQGRGLRALFQRKRGAREDMVRVG